MRLLTSLGLLTLSALSAAQEALGTKADIALPKVSPSPGAPGLAAFFQTAIVLGIVLVLLKVLIPRIITKLGGRLTTPVGASIRIEESANFAGGSLYVVEVRGKTLLLGVGTNGVTCLSDLSIPRSPDLPTFGDLLASEVGTPSKAAETRPPTEVIDVLARLDTLTR